MTPHTPIRWTNAVSSLILAVVLGFIIWLSASNAALERTQYPRGSESTLPIALENLGEGLIVTSGGDQRVTVDLLTDLEGRARLAPDDFLVIADLAGLGAGRHQVQVQVSRSPLAPNFRLLEWFPNRISVEIAEAKEIELPVEVVISDPQSVGVDYQVDLPDVTPKTVVLRGPSALVDSVERVVADVRLSGASETLTRTVELSLESAAGTLPTNDIELSSNEVVVIVPIGQRPGYSTLTVLPDISGEAELLDGGFWISSRTTSPESITVGGDREAIERMSGVVRTEPIDISDFNEDTTRTTIERQVRLVLPDNVTPSRSDRVTVTLEIRTQDSSRTVEITPTVVGLQPGLRIAENGIVPATTDVLLRGPILELRDLDIESVDAELDLEGLAKGTHEVPVTVRQTGNLVAESIIPSRVSVTIEEVQGERTLQLPVRVNGLPDETEATAEPRFVAVTLSGPVPELSALDVSEMVATVVYNPDDPSVGLPTFTAPGTLTVARITPSEVIVRSYPSSELRTVVSLINAVGTADNLSSDLSATAVRIRIRVQEGAVPLDADDIQATVNTSALTEGNHLLPVDILLPEGYELIAVNPDRIIVTLIPKAES
ncbi:MAG: hypothetical protein KDD73_01110 [Anaerolineales bacterium]|nr:hypothetical protein [Anaerolineales bacterium]MCB9126988.1 hypothetical protein [Ardenticatenales bacterium]